ncbi:MAG: hypothetical protein IJJ26_09005, partial [Victivallales bacterium]|nr:hypothetical protein [Victivallales bacterium]
CGFNHTTSQNVMWVLSRMRVEFLRTPHCGETVSLKTWPSGFDRLLALREYLMTDSQGETLMRGTSFWVLLDFQNGRPLRLPDALPFPLPDNSSLPQFFQNPPRIAQDGLGHPMEVVVRETMIDVNQHLNNARYITFVADWLSRELGDPTRLAELSVVYNRATPVGTHLVITGSLEAGGAFRVRIDGAEEGSGLLPRFLAQGRVSQE